MTPVEPHSHDYRSVLVQYGMNPIGAIIYQSTSFGIPEGWYVADGTKGTVNMGAAPAGTRFIQRIR